jgi:hypothetical protein
MAAFAARFMMNILLSDHAAPHYGVFDVDGQGNFWSAYMTLSPGLTLRQSKAELKTDFSLKRNGPKNVIVQDCLGDKKTGGVTNAIR